MTKNAPWRAALPPRTKRADLGFHRVNGRQRHAETAGARGTAVPARSALPGRCGSYYVPETSNGIPAVLSSFTSERRDMLTLLLTSA